MAGRKPTFSFIPAHHLKKPETRVFVSYNAKTQFLSFIRRNNPIVDGYEGKYVQLYADIEKKALAWTFAPTTYTTPHQLKGYTPIRTTNIGTTKLIRIYVPRPVVHALGMTENMRRVEVKTWESTGHLDFHKIYHYIHV